MINLAIYKKLKDGLEFEQHILTSMKISKNLEQKKRMKVTIPTPISKIRV